MKGLIKIYDVNTNQKKAGVALLISDKTDVRARKIVRDEAGYCIMLMN